MHGRVADELNARRRRSVQEASTASRTVDAERSARGWAESKSVQVRFLSLFIYLGCSYTSCSTRIVRNDFVSKPLSKGILDGNLLAAFEGLSVTKQNEMTRQIGTERGVVLRDWITLGGAW